LTEYFIENLKKEALNPEFPRELLMNIARYVNKTLEIVQKFLRLVPELLPILNKSAKKGEEDLKKKTIALQKAFNICYKEIIDYSLKNLSVIQDYLQNINDLSSENKWGKKFKEIMKGNKAIYDEIVGKTENGGFKIESTVKMVVWTLLNEYSMFAALNVSNAKEISKTLKNLKI